MKDNLFICEVEVITGFFVTTINGEYRNYKDIYGRWFDRTTFGKLIRKGVAIGKSKYYKHLGIKQPKKKKAWEKQQMELKLEEVKHENETNQTTPKT